jgi:hypothetical protein
MRLRFAVVLAVLAGALSGCAGERGDCNLAATDAAASGCVRAWEDANLKLNDLLAVGTHISYKLAIPPKMFAMLTNAAPQVAATLDYSHIALDAQLDAGARAIEIDVAYDPKGGLFAHPLGPTLTGEAPPAGYAETMSKPGFKVLHAQDIDFRSNCLTLVECLTILKKWSRAHPDHIPILITMNAKDDAIPLPGSVVPLKFDAAAFDAWDAEIRSVMAPGDLITPDDVQGAYPTLREAVLAGNWPTLGASRGKFLFALDEEGAKIALYRGPRRSLEGRAMFVNAPEDSPAAAYLTLNEALSDTAHITADVKAGYLVRTRADADTKEARLNDTRRREAALASGAQYVSTDYMVPDTRFSSYSVALPDGAVALCNPVRAAGKCGSVTE